MWGQVEVIIKNMWLITIPYETEDRNKKFAILNIHQQANVLKYMIIWSLFQGILLKKRSLIDGKAHKRSQTKTDRASEEFSKDEDSKSSKQYTAALSQLQSAFYNIYQSYVVFLEFTLRTCFKYPSQELDEEVYQKLGKIVSQLRNNQVVKSHFTKDKAAVFIRRKNEFALSILKNMWRGSNFETNDIIVKKLKDVASAKKVKRKPIDLIKFYNYLLYELKMLEYEKKHNYEISKKYNSRNQKPTVSQTQPQYFYKPRRASIESEVPTKLENYKKNSVNAPNDRISKDTIMKSKNKQSETKPKMRKVYKKDQIDLKNSQKSLLESTNPSKPSQSPSKPKSALWDITNTTSHPITHLNKHHQHPFPTTTKYYQIPPPSTLPPPSPSTFTPTLSPTNAFLPNRQNRRYSLVLDLDETLIHFLEENERQQHEEHMGLYTGTGGYAGRKQVVEVINGGVIEYFYVRPYLRQFLSEMAKYYELVIFTAGTQDYADSILDALFWYLGSGYSQCISHRLYRQHTRNEDDVYVKDLDLIRSDKIETLTSTIIIDNTKGSFLLLDQFR